MNGSHRQPSRGSVHTSNKQASISPHLAPDDSASSPRSRRVSAPVPPSASSGPSGAAGRIPSHPLRPVLLDPERRNKNKKRVNQQRPVVAKTKRRREDERTAPPLLRKQAHTLQHATALSQTALSRLSSQEQQASKHQPRTDRPTNQLLLLLEAGEFLLLCLRQRRAVHQKQLEVLLRGFGPAEHFSRTTGLGERRREATNGMTRQERLV